MIVYLEAIGQVTKIKHFVQFPRNFEDINMVSNYFIR
jgi:hypothetical protein